MCQLYGGICVNGRRRHCKWPEVMKEYPSTKTT